MKTKLIAETGKCKLKAFDYPVRIHATDVGIDGDLICGDYEDLDGLMMIAWDKNGKYINNDESYDLVPIPQFYYFNVYESNRDNPTAGSFKTSINELPKKGSGSMRLIGTYKYTDGVIEKVEEE